MVVFLDKVENGVDPIVLLGLGFNRQVVCIEDLEFGSISEFIEDIQDGQQPLEIRFIFQDLYFFTDFLLGAPRKGYPSLGFFKEPADIAHFRDGHKLGTQKICFHLHNGFTCIAGTRIRKAAVRQVGADQYQISLGIIGYVTAYLPFAVPPVDVNQFNLRVVMPHQVLVRPLRIEFLVGKGMPEIGLYGLKCWFEFLHINSFLYLKIRSEKAYGLCKITQNMWNINILHLINTISGQYRT